MSSSILWPVNLIQKLWSLILVNHHCNLIRKSSDINSNLNVPFVDAPHLVILDPTSAVWKNVTPNCYRIGEIMNLFAKFANELDALKVSILGSFDEEGVEISQASANSLVALKIEEIFGENSNLIFNFFGVKH